MQTFLMKGERGSEKNLITREELYRGKRSDPKKNYAGHEGNSEASAGCKKKKERQTKKKKLCRSKQRRKESTQHRHVPTLTSVWGEDANGRREPYEARSRVDQ